MAEPSVGKRVDAATSDVLIMSDWAMNAAIADSINDDASGQAAKEAIKHLRKRIAHSNDKVVQLAFMLLDYLVKNCHLSLWICVASRDMTASLRTLATGRAGTARELSLRFIQHTALGLDAHKASLPLLAGLYTDLRSKGAPFPPVEDAEVRTLASLNAMATPGGFQDYGFDMGDDFDEDGFQSATRVVPASEYYGSIGGGPSRAGFAAPAPVPAASRAPAAATPQELAKLGADLDLVLINVKKASVLVASGRAVPTSEEWLDNEDFLKQCVPRLGRLIDVGLSGDGRLPEELLQRCLDLNDHVLAVLEGRPVDVATANPIEHATASAGFAAPGATADLLGLDGPAPVTHAGPAAAPFVPQAVTEPFAAFAPSAVRPPPVPAQPSASSTRVATKPTPVRSAAAATGPAVAAVAAVDDVAALLESLGASAPSSAPAPAPSSASAAVPLDDFDAFLEARAPAAPATATPQVAATTQQAAPTGASAPNPLDELFGSGQ